VASKTPLPGKGHSVISRRAFVAAVTVGFIAGPVVAGARPGGRIARIGLLGTAPPGSTGSLQLVEAFVQALRELGYVEGRNFVLERRQDSEGRPGRLVQLAAELVRLEVDVIVATGTLAPHAAKSATRVLPVVFTNHGDPVGSGLVVSLARPGGKVTGLSLLAGELVSKQLELLKKVAPRIVRVAILWNPNTQTHPGMLNEAESAARALDLQLERLGATGLGDYDRAFAAMTQWRADALLALGDPVFWNQRARIVGLAAKHRVPAMFGQREFVEAGGLMSYGANVADNFRRAAIYVDKILNGARPGDLPIEQPARFELVISSGAARVLGLRIPESVVMQADRIIE
jgi:putative ABC transport system substrate-binding protein